MTTARNEALLLLRLRKQRMTKREWAALKKKKPPRMAYPVAIEHSYAQDISVTMKRLAYVALSYVERRLSTWIALSDASPHMDGLDTELEDLLKEVEAEVERIFMAGGGISEVAQYIASTASRVFQFKEEQWRSQLMVVLGTPLDTSASWWPEARQMWINENYRLIKSLSQEYITKLNTTLMTGFQSGWTFEEMVGAIRKLSDAITGYRARLIARDQIGKLQYTITRKQFESIGMDGYMWYTARDERVRGNPVGRYPKAIPSHWIMDEKICKFSDPTVFSELGYEWLKRYPSMPQVHPGQAIACRCTSAPYWLPILREAENI